MRHSQGFTLIEIMVVLIIIGLVAAFALPNFTASSEQAKSLNAWNNLLAIYSAEQNYNNNNGGNGTYCAQSTSNPTCADTLADINTNLSLSIQDDGSYGYSCSGVTCTATRNISPTPLTITVTLSSAILTGNVNPNCSSTTGNSNWCP